MWMPAADAVSKNDSSEIKFPKALLFVTRYRAYFFLWSLEVASWSENFQIFKFYCRLKQIHPAEHFSTINFWDHYNTYIPYRA